MAIDTEPSPLKNVTSGLGCGCGCFGLLTVFAGSVALGGIPLGLYNGGPGAIPLLGGLTIFGGLTITTLGGAIWALSLFVDIESEPE